MAATKAERKDAGWAWVVLVAATLAVTICCIALCNGVFNIVFLEEFGKSKSTTALCGGLQIGLLNMAGILGSVLLRRFGLRVSLLVGATLIFTGFFGCHFAKSFRLVLLLYGLTSGLGCGIAFTTSMVAVSQYFSKYRNIAFGISNTGSGFALLLFTPLLEFLLHEYGLRGTMLIVSAIVANLFICALLMRPVEDDEPEIGENESEAMSSNTGDNPRRRFTSSSSLQNTSKFQYETAPSKKDADAALNHERCMENTIQHGISCETYDIKEEPTERSREWAESKVTHVYEVKTGEMASLEKETTMNEIKKAHVVNTHGYQLMPERSTAKSLSPLVENMGENRTLSSAEPGKKNLKQLLLNIKNNEVCSGMFLSYLLSFFLQGIGYSATYLHLPAYIAGVSGTQSMLLTSMGIIDIICRSALGFATNKFSSHVLAIYIAFSLIAGVTLVCVPLLCRSLLGQLVFALFFTCFGNSFITLAGAMNVQLAGLANFSVAFATTFFVLGVGCLVGPLLAGWFYDITGSYAYTFGFAGASYMLGCLVMFVAAQIDGICRRVQKLRGPRRMI